MKAAATTGASRFDVELAIERACRRSSSAMATGSSDCGSVRPTLPDYGLVLSQPRALQARRSADGSLRIEAGTAALIIDAGSAARDARARRRRRPALDHRRAFPRLDAPAGVRPAATARAVDRRRSRSTSGEPVYGLGEKFGAARTSAGSSCIRRSRTRSASTRGSRTRTRRSAWSPGTGRARGACSSTRRACVSHGVGHPGLVAPQLRGRSSRTKRSTCSCSPADYARGDPRSRYTQLTGRAPAVPRWSLGLWVSRAYYATPRRGDRRRRAAARAQDSRATC